MPDTWLIWSNNFGGNRTANIIDSEPSQSQPTSNSQRTSDGFTPDSSDDSDNDKDFIDSDGPDSDSGNGQSILQQYAPELFRKSENSMVDLTETEFFLFAKILIKNSLDENYLKEVYFETKSEELRIVQKLDQGNF